MTDNIEQAKPDVSGMQQVDNSAVQKCTKHKQCENRPKCRFLSREEFLKRMREGWRKWKERGGVVQTISKNQQDMIIDLYTRGVRLHEISQIVNLDYKLVAKVIKRAFNAMRLKLRMIKSNPDEELTYLIMVFDNIFRLSLTQFSAQDNGIVKEKFLSNAMKAILCKIKLLVDTGILSGVQFSNFMKEAELIDDSAKELSIETKEKLRQVLKFIKGGGNNGRS